MVFKAKRLPCLQAECNCSIVTQVTWAFWRRWGGRTTAKGKNWKNTGLSFGHSAGSAALPWEMRDWDLCSQRSSLYAKAVQLWETFWAQFLKAVLYCRQCLTEHWRKRLECKLVWESQKKPHCLYKQEEPNCSRTFQTALLVGLIM